MAAQNIETETGAKASVFSKIKLFGLFAAATVWAWLTGYYKLFGFLGPWEDEGYLIMTVKQYMDGDVLYDEIITIYGPAYYVYKWLVHTLLGLPVTHDISRLTTLVVWVLISLLGGLFAYRLTRSALGGAAAYALVFIALFRTAAEPVHPSELLSLMILASLHLLPGDRSARYFNLRLVLVGAAMAVASLTKLNIGFFLCFAFAVIFIAFTAASRLQRLALIAVTAGAALLPFVLFKSRLSLRWFEFALLIAVSVVASLTVGLIKNNRAVFTVRDYAVTAAAFLGTGFLIVSIVCLRGVSLHSLIDGLIFVPLRFGDLVVMEAAAYRFIKFWALIAALTAAAIIFFKERKPFETEVGVAILKAAFGASIIVALLIGYYDVTASSMERIFGKSDIFDWVKGNEGVGSFLLLNFATPFLWLLIAEPLLRREFSTDLVLRAALAVTAILQTLHAYPVPASQMAPAVFLIAIVGVVCLCDGFAQLKQLLPESLGAPRLQAVLAAASILILFVACVHRTYAERRIYYGGLPLNLYGSARIRLPEREVAAYNFITENIKYNCDSLFPVPSIFSFYFWAQKESPTKLNAYSWMNILSDAQQQSIIETLKTSKSGCVVYNRDWTKYWAWKLTEEDWRTKVPLSAYIFNNYTSRGEANGYEFMRQNSAPEELVYAARFVPGEANTIELVLPPASAFEIHRVELYNAGTWRSLADSKTNQPVLLNERNEAVNFPLNPTDESIPVRKYRLRWTSDNLLEASKQEELVLRLYNGKNVLIASLPFSGK